MLIIALAFVLVPLFRHHDHLAQVTREKHNIRIHKEHLQELQDAFNSGSLGKEDFEIAVRELEQQLLGDVKSSKENHNNKIAGRPVLTAISIVVLLPLFVASYYLFKGEVELIGVQPDVAGQQQTSGDKMHSSEEMVERLRNRLQEQPDDVAGWNLLGRSYFVMDRYDDAVTAYRKVHELVGDEAPLLADLAEVLIAANDNRFTQESLDMITHALQIDPDEPKALWIAGYAALEQGDHIQALQYWEKLLNQLPPDGQDASVLRENIAQIKQGTALIATEESPVAANNSDSIMESAPHKSSSSIKVQVVLDAAYSDKVAGADTVFIFARAAEGPRMPLAIVRKQVQDLPLEVKLDDSMAMSPEMSLSHFKQVVVGARVSKSGNAMPESGDLQGTSGVVKLDEIASIKVIINEALP
jgi:cytochrome c-type biogenesis protein CcmH